MELRYSYPRILFGAGTAEELPRLSPADARRVLLVMGRSSESNGLKDRFSALLADFDVVESIGAVPAEPPLDCVEELVSLGRSENVDAVVAVGGGSVIDAAKTAAAVIPLDGSAGDYFGVAGRDAIPLPRKGLFFVALPTTAGTGAEVTRNAVLTDTSTGIKKSIRSDFMVPDVAVVDPELTLSLPADITANSGFDALTQAIESFTCPAATVATKALAEAAVVKIMGSIESSCADGGDIVARSDMAEGSLLSAMSFSQSGLGAVHGLAHPLGAALKLPHGFVCAVLLPYILELNAEAAAGDYSRLSRALGLDSVDAFTAEIRSLEKKLGVPEGFDGLEKERYPFILSNCRGRSMKGNPRHLSNEEITALLDRLAG